ncbi:MEMO1 family [Dioszegia hungarica]|uniref:MEMO1 family n=1 Tax=Dioszegia hungarica TaxID=4972 RepID=A0AA38H514_9TREE|nr:MEMO1 family [Dioszegia hungarica]KAI9632951.1 MEMO1 family [Dioszegia hungarica]
MSGTREATHAGSWYTSSGSQLESELDGYLAKVDPIPELDYAPPVANAKAVIAPHAGYSYSGPAAAWAYAAIPTQRVKRVFLLGPSHHAYLSGVALSRFETYGTPLGDIPLCKNTISELQDSGLFSDMSPSVDEDEHSLEMHLPYIRHIFSGIEDLRLIPILVGHPDARTMGRLSEVLGRYWAEEDTFFVISSDFCHWGTRFSCTPYYPSAPHPSNPVPPVPAAYSSTSTSSAPSSPPEMVKRFDKPGTAAIWESIQYMDHEGMDLLRRPAGQGAVDAWERYLSRTKNTICGRNPITVLLHLVQHVYAGKPEAEHPEFVFVRYEQSSRCMAKGDSSNKSYV